ncbi:MAG: DoxX family membrane protein [Desulfuromonadales bacterium]|nr:DoxX family membrane protein [Desulfuromonadales bacterium]NIS42878.1 DoxX family membrane protein [Desulfuromonadales bacterium]
MNRASIVLYHLCRLALGGVFVFAGAVKSQDVTAFAGEIANYRILPYTLNYLAAATLPYVEVLAGAFLLANRKVRPAALLVAALNVVFMIALASAMVRGLDIDCGCFRAESATTPAVALVRDAGFLLLAVIVFWLRGGRMPPSRPDDSEH